MDHTPVSTKKRKFPGPAGLLSSSDQDISSKLKKQTTEPDLQEEESNAENVPLSQTTYDVFSSPSWKALVEDLGPEAEKIISKFSIKVMLLKAKRRVLPKGKIPLILGYVETMDMQGQDASVAIRDTSGKMMGSLHRELFQDPLTAIQIGCVLVLRQVSVISPSVRTHYLNITPDNVALIYSPSLDDRSVYKRVWEGSPTKTSSVNMANSPSISDIVKDSELELSTPQRITSFIERFPSPNTFSSPLLQTPGNNSRSFSFKSPVYNSKNSPSPLFTPPSRQNSPQVYHPASRTENKNTAQNNNVNSLQQNRTTSFSSHKTVNIIKTDLTNQNNVNNAKNIDYENLDEAWFSDDDDDLLMCGVTDEDFALGKPSNPVNDTSSSNFCLNTAKSHNEDSVAVSTSCITSSINSNIFLPALNKCENVDNTNSECVGKLERDSRLQPKKDLISSIEEEDERDSRILQKAPLPQKNKQIGDEFWENDLSDELLSQLTEDF